MKYNQQTRKEYLEEQLRDIFIVLNISEEKIIDITFREIRIKLNEIYPPISAPSTIGYPSPDSIFRDRKRILNKSRNVLYELNAIRNREKNDN
jgi:hypothetical protein